jgi:hypothetical protein
MKIRKSFHKLLTAGAIGALGAAAAGSASASVVASVTGLDNYTFTGTAQVLIPSTTTPLFAQNKNQLFVVTFSAESAVEAPAGNYSAWEDIDIVVVNSGGKVVATLAPTVGAFDAFASSNGNGDFSWSMHSITVVGGATLPAGKYRVQVLARLNNGGTTGWFGERSLVVQR